MRSRENAEGGTPQIPAEALDAPDDAASLEIERCPVALRLECSAADENRRADRAIVLLLLKGGSKTIDASVAVEGERAGFVDDRVPVGVDQNRRGREFLEERPYDSLHGWRKKRISPLTSGAR